MRARASRVRVDARHHWRAARPFRAVRATVSRKPSITSNDRPLPVGVHSPGHVAATDDEAMDQMWPHYLDVVGRVGRIRGWAPPTKDQFVREAGPHGAWYIGSPETVASKIARNLPALGATRFDLKYGMAGLPHDAVMTNIELYGTQVVPRVRALLAETEAASEAT